VEHIEIDAESHLDLVRDLKVLSTPTVFVLDADGVVGSRATGLPGSRNGSSSLLRWHMRCRHRAWVRLTSRAEYHDVASSLTIRDASVTPIAPST